MLSEDFIKLLLQNRELIPTLGNRRDQTEKDRESFDDSFGTLANSVWAGTRRDVDPKESFTNQEIEKDKKREQKAATALTKSIVTATKLQDQQNVILREIIDIIKQLDFGGSLGSDLNRRRGGGSNRGGMPVPEIPDWERRERNKPRRPSLGNRIRGVFDRVRQGGQRVGGAVRNLLQRVPAPTPPAAPVTRPPAAATAPRPTPVTPGSPPNHVANRAASRVANAARVAGPLAGIAVMYEAITSAGEVIREGGLRGIPLNRTRQFTELLGVLSRDVNAYRELLARFEVTESESEQEELLKDLEHLRGQINGQRERLGSLAREIDQARARANRNTEIPANQTFSGILANLPEIVPPSPPESEAPEPAPQNEPINKSDGIQEKLPEQDDSSIPVAQRISAETFDGEQLLIDEERQVPRRTDGETSQEWLQNQIQNMFLLISDTEFKSLTFKADSIIFNGRIKGLQLQSQTYSVPGAGETEGGGGSIPQSPSIGGQGQYSSGGMGSVGGGTGGAGGNQSEGPLEPSTPGGGSIPGAQQNQTPGISGSGGSTGQGVERITPPAPATPGLDAGVGSTPSADSGPPITEIIQTGPGFNVVKYQDGRVERRTGARNWRNNNPGNLEFGDFARRFGAIGSDGRFAIFPTYEAGKRAKEALIFEGRGYAGMTIAQAITRYAPPSENDTNRYIATVAAAVGASPNTPLASLNADQRRAMIAAMERVEGFRPGQVQVLQQGTGQAVASQQQSAPPQQGAALQAAGTEMVAQDQRQQRSAWQIIQQQQQPPTQSSTIQTQQSTTRGEVPLSRRLETQV